ncbi:helix-turn-helix domain-containing protein [Streptomyces sp. NPDC093509]|uniref:helix-turn-helix domain-containing protein n=1 Tax=Streptomyces sp. NPDC093509 TaxID=3154982 RepID=UPI00344C0FC5
MKHLKEVRVLQPENPDGFQLTVAGFYIGNVLAAVQRSGSVTAVSGGSDSEDPIVIHAVTSGSIVFNGTREQHMIQPGKLIVRDSGRPWNMACKIQTASHVITIPRSRIKSVDSASRLLKRALLADAKAPAAKLLFAYLNMLRTSDILDSLRASELAERAFLTLLSGVIEGENVPTRIDPDESILTARAIIEQNLENGDLTPALVANELGVSVRTLHRLFSASDHSVMSLIRQLRMERARVDLLSTGSVNGISCAAAKWHFSDASHFIRNFKQIYGITPRSYVQENSNGKN